MSVRAIKAASGTDEMRAATPSSVDIQYDTADNIVKYKDDAGTIRKVVTQDGTETLTAKTLTTPTIDGVAYSAANDRQIIVEAVPISGAALQAANLTLWTAPAAAIILRVLLDVTTVATAACTVDIGYTATTATTSSDTLLDGVDVNAAIALFDSMNAALDSGANAKAQKAASGKWITADSASGDATGLVATAYIFYILA